MMKLLNLIQQMALHEFGNGSSSTVPVTAEAARPWLRYLGHPGWCQAE